MFFMFFKTKKIRTKNVLGFKIIKQFVKTKIKHAMYLLFYNYKCLDQLARISNNPKKS